jgi:hypothetical protein
VRRLFWELAQGCFFFFQTALTGARQSQRTTPETRGARPSASQDGGQEHARVLSCATFPPGPASLCLVSSEASAARRRDGASQAAQGTTLGGARRGRNVLRPEGTAAAA